MSPEEQRPTRKRYGILVLVFVSVVINYMDRSNISVAAIAIGKDLSLDTVQMGLIFSAFAWTYVALQIPGGIVVDLVRPRILYSIILFFWSVATFFQGFARSFLALVGFRMSIGVFESPSFPANNRIVTSWFPESERASAIAVYTSGQFIGLAFLTPTLVFIQTLVGWRGLFIVSGIIGIVWALVWYLFYRDPGKHKRVNQMELDHIRKGGGILDFGQSETKTQKDKKGKVKWKDLSQAFIYRKLWGLYIGQFCMGSLFVFFLTWFPTYLVEFRGLDFLQTGMLASIPFLAAFLGVLISGFTSDYLTRKGVSAEVARKAPVLTGMLIMVSVIGANYASETFYVIMFLAIAFFGNGLASIGWVFVSLIAPKPLIGLVGGVFNFLGGLSAVIIPIVIGFIVKEGSFEPALFLIAALAILGFFSYLFLMGKVERIGEPN